MSLATGSTFGGNVEDEDWRFAAKCKNTAAPDIFYSYDAVDIRKAKQECNACPVRSECLNFAFKTLQDFGVWGGLSARERRKVKRKQLQGRLL